MADGGFTLEGFTEAFGADEEFELFGFKAKGFEVAGDAREGFGAGFRVADAGGGIIPQKICEAGGA